MGNPPELYYKVLNIAKDTPPQEIRAAYRVLVRQWHPDKHPPESKPEAEARFKAITHAYEALLDQQEDRAVLRTRNDVDDEARSCARAAGTAAMARAPGSEKARTSAAPPPPPPRTPPARESQKVYSSTDIGGSGRRAFAEFSSYVVRKAPPLERKVECTLEELCAGCKKEVTYTRDVVTKNGSNMATYMGSSQRSPCCTESIFRTVAVWKILQFSIRSRTRELKCVAFLVNFDKHQTQTVVFHNISLQLAPKSISILSDCRTVVFETAKHGSRTAEVVQSLNDIHTWKAFKEPIPQDISKSVYTGNQLLEHLSTTKDETDYLWYIVSYEYRKSDDGQLVLLNVESRAHILHAFVNSEFVGSVHGSHDAPGKIILNTNISLKEGQNTISLLSVMVGSPDSGAHMETRSFGIRKVSIQQGQQPLHILNNELWGYQVGLLGEGNRIYTQEGSSSVKWTDIYNLTNLSLTWYQTSFATPMGDDAVTLNLTSMGKGEVWINGESIGRYWVSFKTPSGQSSQSLYHIPQHFLKPRDNLLVLVEEMGGDPLQITVNTVSITTVCGNVNELSAPALHTQGRDPEVRLRCQRGKHISAIEFASYGNPAGDCTAFSTGSCHAESSESIVKQACIGKRVCSIPVSPAKFGSDPCPGIQKSLLVVANCK